MRKAYITVIEDSDGKAIDFTDTSVTYEIKLEEEIITSGNVDTGKNGEVLVVFDTYDIRQSGVYNIEITVKYSDGREEIYPNITEINL